VQGFDLSNPHLIIRMDLIYQTHIMNIKKNCRGLIYQARTFIKQEKNEKIEGNPHFR
jgi:hypothetical protein